MFVKNTIRNVKRQVTLESFTTYHRQRLVSLIHKELKVEKKILSGCQNLTAQTIFEERGILISDGNVKWYSSYVGN
jgi:hypothetical protein